MNWIKPRVRLVEIYGWWWIESRYPWFRSSGRHPNAAAAWAFVCRRWDTMDWR